MIVVDTNVIVYFWINGTFTDAAEILMKKDPEWASPLLWRSEFCNVLAGYLRKHQITLAQALAAVGKAQEHLKGREHSIASEVVLDLVNKSVCSAYDCEFVALAQSFGISLVTCDSQILKAFPETAIHLERFSS